MNDIVLRSKIASRIDDVVNTCLERFFAPNSARYGFIHSDVYYNSILLSCYVYCSRVLGRRANFFFAYSVYFRDFDRSAVRSVSRLVLRDVSLFLYDKEPSL